MIVGSTKEDLTLEKRVSLTPETAKNIIGLGLKVCIEKNYASHLGIEDKDFVNAGVEVKNSSAEVLKSSNFLKSFFYNFLYRMININIICPIIIFMKKCFRNSQET